MDAKPTGKLIGYARVSSDDQEMRMQIDDLQRAGCWNIWKEHRSAWKRHKRPELEKALADLRPGDTFVVWKLDRLARNLGDAIVLIDRIGKAGAGFMALRDKIDLTTAVGRLMFHVIGAFAEFEVALTSERTGAGIAALRAAGWSPGAPQKLSKEKAARMVAERKEGKPLRGLAKKYGLSTAGVSLYVKRAKRRRPKKS